jgi:hypothetical protein
MAPLPRGNARHPLTWILACCALIASTLPVVACADRTEAQVQPQAAAPAPSPSTTTEAAESDTANPDVTPARRAVVRRPPSVTVASTGTLTWAYLDRITGSRYQSDNATETSYTESMVKAWLAADELRRAAESDAQPAYDLLIPMIIDRDDDAAESVYYANGADESIDRMINYCGLVDTQITSGWWSMTLMSARDAVNLGQCIVDGTAAGPGTDWLLAEMRQVGGEGRFGIIDALTSNEASQVAIKNGWTLHYDDGIWRVNCLAIHPDWIIAVMTTYPGTDSDLSYGAALCQQVTSQLLTRTAR